ncbi:phosphocholine cytidylyltransferase family protein [Gracilibacillus alcaliphilus]|uniref:phosphocholine cytidylyltransferase family protein n=1 Tax=Gracilibacillus alcaliphilus TaxID=1401441 RepID=UPI0019583388|nr:sugar phosphate nucleotidyltransferase [Gracilibacillus alcaliphilus]MBM7676022.1 choline kinase [Gracilibacillus alcaliphilus]
MNLFILAAGKGKRLKAMTKHIPKPLITIGTNGMTILEHNINHALASQCFDQITVITGYKSHMIDQCLAKYQTANINTVFNDMYRENGPISSLSQIERTIKEEDCVIINGDTLYDPMFYNHLKEQTNTGLYYSKKELYQQDEVKVTILNQNIQYASKNITLDEIDGVSTGFVILKGLAVRERFCYYVDKMSTTNYMWHEIINKLIQEGLSFCTFEIGEEYWYEIDTVHDYNKYQLLKG